MKPFDITKPVQTVDGRPARIICTDRKGNDAPIVALVRDGKVECTHYYCAPRIDRYLITVYGDEKANLVNVPEEVTGYVNIYPDGPPYSSRAEADSVAGSNRIACVKVTFREGQFDE